MFRRGIQLQIQHLALAQLEAYKYCPVYSVVALLGVLLLMLLDILAMEGFHDCPHNLRPDSYEHPHLQFHFDFDFLEQYQDSHDLKFLFV